jgi:hypothetical protein
MWRVQYSEAGIAMARCSGQTSRSPIYDYMMMQTTGKMTVFLHKPRELEREQLLKDRFSWLTD